MSLATILLAGLPALLLLGDSLAVGMRPHLPVDRAVTIVGAGSDWRWESYADRRHLAVLVIGSNDLPSAALGARARQIGEALLGRSAGVVVVGPPCSPDAALDRRLRSVETLQRLALAGTDVRFEPLRAATQDGAGDCPWAERARDGLHFTPVGYRGLALWLQRRIAP